MLVGAGGSATATVVAAPPSVLPARLTLAGTGAGTAAVTAPSPDRTAVHWTADTVDNEFAGRRSSKRCCIFHKQRAPGDFESSDEDSDDGGDKKAAANASAGGGGVGGGLADAGAAGAALAPRQIADSDDDSDVAAPSAAMRAARAATRQSPGSTRVPAPAPDPANCKHCALLAGLVAARAAESVAASATPAGGVPAPLP